MAKTTAAAPRAAKGRVFEASVSALLATSALVTPSYAGSSPLFTSAWLSARGASAGSSASAVASALAGATPTTIGNVMRSMQDLQRTAQALAAARAVQAQARQIGSGMIGGLPQPADGLAPGGLVTQMSSGWSGATLPTQAVIAGQTTVTVGQTSAQALLHWSSFNVGRHTTLNFDQSAGGAAANTWVAVNEITDPSQNPSQILGSMTAQGQVFVINPNGVIFGSHAQVNVGALIASAATLVGGDTQFLKTGIYGPGLSGTTEILPAFSSCGTASCSSGGVTVAAGAQITTNAASSPLSTGGYVLLMGASVQNAGEIVTANGQTALAAGQNFVIQPGYSATSTNSGTTGNLTSTVRGNEIAVSNASSMSTAGSVSNTGLISASTGDISLVGHAVMQNGVLLSTTTTEQRGTIHLLTDTTDDTTSVTIGPQSTMAITLDTSGSGALNSQRAGAITASASADASRVTQAETSAILNDEALLSDRQDLSRVEITTGGLVDFQSGSLTLATGGQVAVSARTIPAGSNPATSTGDTTGRVFVESGAIIDVSGATSAVLAASSNAVAVSVQGFELRDASVNRDSGVLNSTTVYVDQRQLLALAGSDTTYPTTRLYTQGGLLEVSGEVGNIDHNVAEFDSSGGTITLSSAQVIAQPGAEFNIAGGLVTYQSGYVPTSWLVSAAGRLFNVNTAPSNVLYTGVFDGFSEHHSRWDVTNTYTSPLIAPSETYDPAYTVGRDAGSLLLSTPVAVFQGQIDAGVTVGQRQDVARSSTVTDSYLQAQNAVPQPGTLALGDFDVPTIPNVFLSNVVVGSTAETSAATLTPTATLTINGTPTDYLSAQALNSFELGGFSVTVGGVGTTVNNQYVPVSGGAIQIESPLTLAPGGTVSLVGADISVDAAVVARGGAVSLTTQTPIGFPATIDVLSDQFVTSIAFGAHGTIDTQGLWTNAVTGGSQSDLAFVNGGSVLLDSALTLDLAAGSAIDASSGAGLLPGNKQVAGRGGNISLIGDDPLYEGQLASPVKRPKKPADQGSILGPVVVDATLSSLGVTGGGAFLLEAPEVVIGDSLSPANAYQVVLPTAFFASGFSGYTVNAFGDGVKVIPPRENGNNTNKYINLSAATALALTVEPGAQVTVEEPTYQFSTASQSVPSGADPASALVTGLLPEYTSNPTNASVTQRPGASLALESVVEQAGTLASQGGIYVAQGGTYTNGGAIEIGTGAQIQVDPGRTIRIESYNQLTVDGTLRAPGGTIQIFNDRYQDSSEQTLTYVPGLSVWIGAKATLDAAGQAFVTTDVYGHPFGTLQAGGTIAIGAPSSQLQTTKEVVSSTNAVVIIQPGATLDVSGASAVLSTEAGLGTLTTAEVPAILVATDAGTISLSSYTGIYPEGAMRGSAGGPSAQGGLLDITLETPTYNSGITAFPSELVQPHEVIFGQTAADLPSLPSNITPGDTATFAGKQAGLFDKAILGVDQLTAGGFTRLSLYTHDLILFQGQVSLDLGQSLNLEAPDLVDTDPHADVYIRAPYLEIGSPLSNGGDNSAGQAGAGTSFTVVSYGQAGTAFTNGVVTGTPFTQFPICGDTRGVCAAGTLDLSANQIDVRNSLRFATDVTITPGAVTSYTFIGQTSNQKLNLPGFAYVNLASGGDIRFLSSGNVGADIAASGDVTLSAAQIYPITPAETGDVESSVDAGIRVGPSGFRTTVDPTSVLTISRSTGVLPAVPLSTFGLLALGAATIDQGGVVRAPEGTIIFGHTPFNTDALRTLNLLPGSVTSASMDGVSVPFGGTTNGVQYSYNGIEVLSPGTVAGVAYTPVFGVSISGQAAVSLVGVTADAAQVNISAGATIDLTGGGTLTGGGGEYLSGSGSSATLLSQGFISGRGGSTDTLTTPFVTFGGGTITAPTLQNGAGVSANTLGVYALVPNLGKAYAPVTGFDYSANYFGSLPVAGEQITLTSATAGLPAGTYTLLPSYYALLPGAYRVQFGQTAVLATTPVGSLRNGSYVTGAHLGYEGTSVSSSLPIAVTLTPGSVVRTYSQYDEEGYAQFVTSSITQFGGVRPDLPQDAKQLELDFFPLSSFATQFRKADSPSALTDSGTVLFSPAPGGYTGSLSISAGGGNSYDLYITPAESNAPTPDSVSVAGDQIQSLGAAGLRLGSNQFGTARSNSLIIESGVTLSAAEIDIPTQGVPGTTNDAFLTGPIIIEPGVTLSTLGAGVAPVFPARGPYPSVGNGNTDIGNGLFLVNGALTLDAASTATGSVEIGACEVGVASVPCGNGEVGLFSDGAIIVAGNVVLGQANIHFGATAFTAFAPVINLSSQFSQGNAGLTLSSGVLSTLFAGDIAAGIPVLQQFTLDATALNILGSFSLNTVNPSTGQSTLGQLVIQAPVINGLGAASDTATITTGTFIWTGLSAAATPVSTGTGSGTLDVIANEIDLGSPLGTVLAGGTAASRTIGGFSTVNLTASQEVTSTNDGNLTVYQSPGSYENGKGFVGTGGTLNIVTPLLTGGAGSVLAISAAGALNVQAPGGVAATNVVAGGLGGEIDLTAPTILADTAIVLPAGRLTMTAQDNITLGAASRLVVSGPVDTMIDQVEYNPGGSVVLQSGTGNITQLAGGLIDVSSVGAAGGTISVAAMGSGGTVALAGFLIGGTGSSIADSGSIDIRANTLGQGFPALNQQLDAGGFYGSRSFELGTGSLVLSAGSVVKAHAVTVSVDAGSLDVEGTIDASGSAPGVIRLSAAAGLTLGMTSVLNASGNVAQYAPGDTLDPVDALNTGSVELTVSNTSLASGGSGGGGGFLTVTPGALINVSDVVSCTFGPCGIVEFNVPRTGETSGNANIAVAVPDPGRGVVGAGTVDVNAFWSYNEPKNVVTQSELSTIDANNTIFINLAVAAGGSGLLGRLSGIYSAQTTTFHLRPGVEITSSGTTGADANLTVAGDLDLSSYRYQTVNADVAQPGAPGAGEAGVFVLRAAGNLLVDGSINDGFGLPAGYPTTTLRTPDDHGWIIRSGQTLIGSLVVPSDKQITLQAGTTFPADATLQYSVPLTQVSLSAGYAVPQLHGGVATLSQDETVSTTFVATAPIMVGKKVIVAAGETVPAGRVFKAGTVLGTGTVLPMQVALDNLTWPAGVSLAAVNGGKLAPKSTVSVHSGETIPAGTKPILKPANGNNYIALRPAVNGVQGVIYGALPMLPANGAQPSQSWSMRLVAGGNLAAADTRAVQPLLALASQASTSNAAPGSIILSDLHFSTQPRHTSSAPVSKTTEAFSVLRTGTGYLDLIAGGNVSEDTLFGVYTAGSQVQADPQYELARQDAFVGTKAYPGNSVLGPTGNITFAGSPSYADLVTQGSAYNLYQAYYTAGGGNVLVAAQGNVGGDAVTYDTSANPLPIPDSDAVGNWLWRQGGQSASGATVSSAWWINFGTYATFSSSGGTATTLIGFTGFGALGGGNVSILAGRNAGYGQGGYVTDNQPAEASGSGLNVAVGGSGRVAASGAITYTGGGDINISVGNTLNSLGSTEVAFSGGAGGLQGLYGTLTDLQGTISVSAGVIGNIAPPANPTASVVDPRVVAPGAQELAQGLGGPVVVPGDANVNLFSRGDLVLTGAGDPTRVTQEDLASAASASAFAPDGLRETWFTLWTPTTSVTLVSAGGNIAPISEPDNATLGSSQTLTPNGNATATDYRYVYPPILDVAAESGSVYVQQYQIPNGTARPFPVALETAPSPVGYIDILAGQSVYGSTTPSGLAVPENVPLDLSGANPSDDPTPQAPAWILFNGQNSGNPQSQVTNGFTTNLSSNAHNVPTFTATNSVGLPLFAFQPDTASPDTHLGGTSVSRIYAVSGDIVDVQVGELLAFASSQVESPSVWQIGGESTRLVAGQDIVYSGITPTTNGATSVLQAPDITGSSVIGSIASYATPSGDLIVNANTSDVSEITAARDILYLNTDVSGPGRLLVQAGRNLYQADQGIIESLGVLDRNAASASGGAGITVIAGAGTAGPDYAGFADLYFNPANLATTGTPLQNQPGKVPQTYQDQLLAFLQQNYGYTGSAADALAYFLTLPPVDQSALVLPVYYSELNQAGLDYNQSSSPFYRTYIRGNLAIATLLPLYANTGYSGAVTLFGGSGIRTDYGGDIQMLAPGGAITLGIEAASTPPASAGVITQGSGNINIYSEGSVLLGQSRVLTTYGGSILIWSRQGDINAGIGSKSTVLSTPVGIVYDNYGDVTLSPTVPSTGAGIGSLAPIPSVPAGDVNLIAPEGTIDAGEAGIRASGNANLAALAVVNAANISVKGSTTGVPTVQAPNLGALSAASATAGAQQQAAMAAAQNNQPKETDSIITVEVLGFGS